MTPALSPMLAIFRARWNSGPGRLKAGHFLKMLRCVASTPELPFGPGRRMLPAVGTRESSMSKAGLDNRHRNKDGEISHKHGNTLVSTLRKIYGPGFAAGYPPTEKLSDVLAHLNETSLSQLRRDHETGHLEHKIAHAPS
jgi:hypothetical protein